MPNQELKLNSVLCSFLASGLLVKTLDKKMILMILPEIN